MAPIGLEIRTGTHRLQQLHHCLTSASWKQRGVSRKHFHLGAVLHARRDTPDEDVVLGNRVRNSRSRLIVSLLEGRLLLVSPDDELVNEALEIDRFERWRNLVGDSLGELRVLVTSSGRHGISYPTGSAGWRSQEDAKRSSATRIRALSQPICIR